MATSLLTKICNRGVFNEKVCTTLSVSVRNGHHMRGKPPGVAKNLEQRLAG